MITISKKYTHGLVAVTRGTRSVLPSTLVTTKRQDRISKVMNESSRACKLCHKAAEEIRETIRQASF